MGIEMMKIIIATMSNNFILFLGFSLGQESGSAYLSWEERTPLI